MVLRPWCRSNFEWQGKRVYPVFEAMVPLPRSMASSLLALSRSCHDLGKDTMAMQDRAKANHDKHELDKGTIFNHDLARFTMFMARVPWLRTLDNEFRFRPLKGAHVAKVRLKVVPRIPCSHDIQCFALE